jgi:hypothetical protein
MYPRANHPKQQLLFFVADDIDEATAREMERLVAELAEQHAWSLGPPTFVNEVDDSSVSSPEDLPIRTLGGILELYSMWPPEGAQLPKELDQANFDDVKTLVASLIAFSSRTGHELDLELAGEPVGSIRGGEPDRILREGFLGEWEQSLKARP